jgi:hypothetical protein
VTSGPHATIINRIAREALQPLGFSQKGRSRLWYADHGWHALVVEFQPSSWSKGTYCNAGAMWLWDPDPVRTHWVFHVHRRIQTSAGDFASFESEGQFETVTGELARGAVETIGEMGAKFRTIGGVASFYGDQPPVGWPGYHGAIALGLLGQAPDAERRFHAVSSSATGSEIRWIAAMGERARSLADLVRNGEAFRETIRRDIATTRKALRLPAIEDPLLTGRAGDARIRSRRR